MQFLDIHTHQLIERAGVMSIQSLSLTDEALLPTAPIAVGLHPWYATLAQFNTQFERLASVALQNNVKLIGECGLDKLKGEKLENQIQILEKQIQLAKKLRKPLILHCVKAFDELIKLKQELHVKVPMIIHGFNKNAELGQQLLAKGFYLSFGKALLNPHSGAAKLVATTNHFFLETDDATIEIEEIYAAAANLKKCSVDELKARIFADWEKII